MLAVTSDDDQWQEVGSCRAECGLAAPAAPRATLIAGHGPSDVFMNVKG
jgi:hypothetical protein